jgi:hypothetical protein
VRPLHHARGASLSLEKPCSEQTKDPANRALRLACSRGTDWGKPVLILGYPGRFGSHIGFQICFDQDNRNVDPIVLVIVLAVGMPLAVVAALAISARLRGPARRPESRRRVESLVTNVIPDEHPDEDELPDDGPTFTIDSPPPERDPGLRGRPEG